MNIKMIERVVERQLAKMQMSSRWRVINAKTNEEIGSGYDAADAVDKAKELKRKNPTMKIKVIDMAGEFWPGGKDI